MDSILSYDQKPLGGAASATADYIQPTFNHALRIWWAFYWRNTLASIVLIVLLAMVVKDLDAADLLSDQAARVLRQMVPYVATFASAVFVLHWVVRKRFRKFRIGLISLRDTGAELAATRARTFRIWLAFMWRAVLYQLIIAFAGSIPLSFVVAVGASISPRMGLVARQLVQTAAAGAASMFVIYSNILDEDIGDSRVTLLPLFAKPLESAEGGAAAGAPAQTAGTSA